MTHADFVNVIDRNVLGRSARADAGALAFDLSKPIAGAERLLAASG